MSETRSRLAVDIGGTFTDLALELDGARTTVKVLTTPAAPEQGVMNGFQTVIQAAGVTPADIGLIIHGTTLATNSIIERKGARTALITTEGFRDVIAMGNESRYDQYDLNIVLPEPLVPRFLRLAVPERLDNTGKILRPLDEAAVQALIPALRQHRVESIAVGLLHAFVNPVHEQLAKKVAAQIAPALTLCISSEVLPEIKEYERTSTTVINAYVRLVVEKYLSTLSAELARIGVETPLLLMQSNGGLTTAKAAAATPMNIIESGPAGS